jgi:hypothetical protein
VTLSCPGPTCPFCTGELCKACPDDANRADGCGHNTKERHGTRDTLNDLDNALNDALNAASNDDDEPAESRARPLKLPPATKPPPILAARVVVEFSGNDNAEEAAIFFETLAKLIRLKRKFIVICE